MLTVRRRPLAGSRRKTPWRGEAAPDPAGARSPRGTKQGLKCAATTAKRCVAGRLSSTRYAAELSENPAQAALLWRTSQLGGIHEEKASRQAGRRAVWPGACRSTARLVPLWWPQSRVGSTGSRLAADGCREYGYCEKQGRESLQSHDAYRPLACLNRGVCASPGGPSDARIQGCWRQARALRTCKSRDVAPFCEAAPETETRRTVRCPREGKRAPNAFSAVSG